MKKLKPSRILVLSTLLTRELIRDKVFLSLSGAAVLLVFASLILNEMVVGIQVKATKDLGLSVMNFFSLFIPIFLGINLVSGNLNNKSLYVIFAKPVTRTQYLLGCFFSVLLAVACGILVITLTIFFLSFLQGQTWIAGLLAAAYLTLLEMTLILSFAIFFALITSPQLAMFLTLLTYIIGHTLQQAVLIVHSSSNFVLKYIIIICNTILPNLEFLNKKQEIIYRLPISFSYYFNATLYTLSYSVLIFIFCVFLSRRKEL